MASRIFISYRRDDSAGHAGRLADHLHKRFGAARVFLDIDTIQAGTDFPTVLHTSLQETAAMLVIIGPRWTSLAGDDGVRRLDDPHDFVRLEVEAALGRNIPVVPVLVQGAAMPRREELPASLAPLVRRQAATLDHAEFHDDAERLADQLAAALGGDDEGNTASLRRVWPVAAAAVIAIAAIAGYFALRGGEAVSSPPESPPRGDSPTVDSPAAPDPRVATLLTAADAQRRRNQYAEALATLAEAQALAPSTPDVRQAQENVAMEWIRDARVQNGSSSFGDVIKPALAVVDTSLASATGARRADLLAHSGWATFLMWRDGDRRLNPTDWYRDALMLDPENPYANAMLAHWVTFQDDDVPRAVTLFATALRSGRAIDAIRTLQWAAYSNSQELAADAERVRLADAMRRRGEALNMRQAQALWSPYFHAMGRERMRQTLLDALPPDDHISTLAWAFDEYVKGDDARLSTRRYYVALLHARAGRVDDARRELRTLVEEMRGDEGSLPNAVRAALKELQQR
jgi:hypothetical protein